MPVLHDYSLLETKRQAWRVVARAALLRLLGPHMDEEQLHEANCRIDDATPAVTERLDEMRDQIMQRQQQGPRYRLAPPAGTPAPDGLRRGMLRRLAQIGRRG